MIISCAVSRNFKPHAPLFSCTPARFLVGAPAANPPQSSRLSTASRRRYQPLTKGTNHGRPSYSGMRLKVGRLNDSGRGSVPSTFCAVRYPSQLISATPLPFQPAAARVVHQPGIGGFIVRHADITAPGVADFIAASSGQIANILSRILIAAVLSSQSIMPGREPNSRRVADQKGGYRSDRGDCR